MSTGQYSVKLPAHRAYAPVGLLLKSECRSDNLLAWLPDRTKIFILIRLLIL